MDRRHVSQPALREVQREAEKKEGGVMLRMLGYGLLIINVLALLVFASYTMRFILMGSGG